MGTLAVLELFVLLTGHCSYGHTPFELQAQAPQKKPPCPQKKKKTEHHLSEIVREEDTFCHNSSWISQGPVGIFHSCPAELGSGLGL
ncbi:hypothetical protein Y1Q_0020391 [Alligator mississippiensis]|uniref:Uncharacterized protein n=1 Tax=Alligator mississippiensis TaxID=8496 RepID=A0A151N6R8_ALLMI|nr:hypothetical protein Y1Q_0020391 [Alligator mississippiensis]